MATWLRMIPWLYVGTMNVHVLEGKMRTLQDCVGNGYTRTPVSKNGHCSYEMVVGSIVEDGFHVFETYCFNGRCSWSTQAVSVVTFN